MWSESFLKIGKWFAIEIIHNEHMQGHPNTDRELNMESGGQMVGPDDDSLREMAIMTLC